MGKAVRKNFKYNKCDFILMTEIIFGGHNWITRNNYGGPGPNHFSHDNVWLDENKRLHSEKNKDGFIPGEGAGFSLVTSMDFANRYRLKPLSMILSGF